MFVCVFEILVWFYLISVPQNYNSLSAYRVRGPFVQTSYKFKILSGGEFEYYKSMGRTTKRGRRTKFLVQWEGDTIFELNLVGGGEYLEETMTYYFATILDPMRTLVF